MALVTRNQGGGKVCRAVTSTLGRDGLYTLVASPRAQKIWRSPFGSVVQGEQVPVMLEKARL
ncbi:MAG: hypothetical protein WAL32_08025 [Terriglobales bacterium]